jgi:hypothetical protein
MSEVKVYNKKKVKEHQDKIGRPKFLKFSIKDILPSSERALMSIKLKGERNEKMKNSGEKIKEGDDDDTSLSNLNPYGNVSKGDESSIESGGSSDEDESEDDDY